MKASLIKIRSTHISLWSSCFTGIWLQVDVDDCEDVAAEYKITAMPTFIFFKNKAKVADLTGANVDKLKEIVASNK